jgi:MFS family permease
VSNTAGYPGQIGAPEPQREVLLPARRDRRAAAIYAWYVLGVLFLVYVINFIDRQIPSILAQDIKASLGVSDAQLGFLYGTAFAIFYSLFGIPLGRLADRWHRGRLIAIGLAVWSAMTVASGLAGSFGHLVCARVGIGIGEASATPAAYSLLVDHFPVRRRALALAIYSAGLPVGAGLSSPLGGWIAFSWSHSYPLGTTPFGLAGWQVAFLGVGFPGLLLAMWVLTLREPMRGAAEGQPMPVVTPGAWRAFTRELTAILPPFTLWSVARFPGALRRNLLLLAAAAIGVSLLTRITGDVAQWGAFGLGVYAVGSWMQVLRATDRPTFTLLFGTRAVVLTLLGFGTVTFIGYSLLFWIPPYVIRTFGVRPDVAGLALGVPSAFAAAAGCIAGGHLSDIWKHYDARGRLFVCMLSVVLATPLIVAMLHASDVRVIYVINPLLAMVLQMSTGSVGAAIQDCVLPRMRGTAGAIFVLAISMLGLALGPYATGKVAAVTGSLRLGLLSLLAMIPPALLLLWFAARRIPVDEASRVERAWAAGEEGQWPSRSGANSSSNAPARA